MSHNRFTVVGVLSYLETSGKLRHKDFGRNMAKPRRYRVRSCSTHPWVPTSNIGVMRLRLHLDVMSFVGFFALLAS